MGAPSTPGEHPVVTVGRTLPELHCPLELGETGHGGLSQGPAGSSGATEHFSPWIALLPWRESCSRGPLGFEIVRRQELMSAE